MKKHNQNKGFTLIELLVVIAIIGVLSGVVMQSLNSARSKSRNVLRLENAEAIAKAFQVATTAANNNQFPSSNSLPVCLGKDTCWPTAGGFSGTTLPALNVNTILKNGLAGGNIPLDPFFPSTENGDSFVYNSNAAGLQGTGSHIFWRMELGGGASCGRGIRYGLSGPTDPYMCQLLLGPGTP